MTEETLYGHAEYWESFPPDLRFKARPVMVPIAPSDNEHQLQDIMDEKFGQGVVGFVRRPFESLSWGDPVIPNEYLIDLARQVSRTYFRATGRRKHQINYFGQQ